MTEEQIICPVCDSEIPANSKTCPVCGVEVSLFDSDMEGSIGNERVEEIIDDDIDEDELFKKIKDLGAQDDYDAEIDESDIDESELLIFECPICNEYVSEDAAKCPNCGAIFEDGEEEEEEESIDLQKVKQDYDNILEEAKTKLADVRETKLDLSILKTLIRDAVTAGKNEDYAKGIESAAECVKSADAMIEIYNYIEVGKEKIKALSEKGIDYKPYLLKLKDIKKKTELGNFEEAGEQLNSTLIEMEEALSKPEIQDIEEEVKEDIEEEVKEDIEERAKEDIEEDVKEDIEEDVKEDVKEDIEEEIEKIPESLQIELDDKINEVKRRLKEVSELNINIDSVKDKIRKGMTAKKEGIVAEAISIMDSVLDDYDDLLDISDQIEVGKKHIIELKDKGLDFKGYLQKMKDAKNTANQGHYAKAKEYLHKTIEEIKSELSKDPKMEKYDDSLVKAMDILEQVRKTHISSTDIEANIDEAASLANSGEIDQAIEKLQYAASKGETILRIRIRIDEAKSRVQELRESEFDYDVYVDALKESKALADKGEYDAAMDTISKAIVEMEALLSGEFVPKDTEPTLEEDIFEDVSEEIDQEELTEEIESEELIEEEVKEDIEEEVEEEPEDVVTTEDIAKQVSELKELLTIAKGYKVKTESGQEIISKAMESSAAGDLERTLTLLEDGKSKVMDNLKDEIDERMVSLELSMEEMTEEAIEAVEELMEEIKSSVGYNDFEEAFTLIERAESFKTELKEPMSKAESTVTDIEKFIFNAELLGLEAVEANELLSKAKEEIDIGDWEAAEDYAKMAKDKILERVPNLLRKIVKEAQIELKKAKISGYDVSKPIDLLKKANLLKDDNELEECLVILKRYRETMKDIKR